MKKTALLILLACSSIAGQQVPKKVWSVETSDPKDVRLDLRYGETVDLECRFLSYAKAMDIAGSTVILHARTNGMEEGSSYQAAGSASTSGVASVRLSVDAWVPQGLTNVAYTLEVTQTNAVRILRATGRAWLTGTSVASSNAPVPNVCASNLFAAIVSATNALAASTTAQLAAATNAIAADTSAEIGAATGAVYQASMAALAALKVNELYAADDDAYVYVNPYDGMFYASYFPKTFSGFEVTSPLVSGKDVILAAGYYAISALPFPIPTDGISRDGFFMQAEALEGQPAKYYLTFVTNGVTLKETNAPNSMLSDSHTLTIYSGGTNGTITLSADPLPLRSIKSYYMLSQAQKDYFSSIPETFTNHFTAVDPHPGKYVTPAQFTNNTSHILSQWYAADGSLTQQIVRAGTELWTNRWTAGLSGAITNNWFGDTVKINNLKISQWPGGFETRAFIDCEDYYGFAYQGTLVFYFSPSGASFPYNKKCTFGGNEDSEIYNNGADLIIDPDVVGSASVRIKGHSKIDENMTVAKTNTAAVVVSHGEVKFGPTIDGKQAHTFTDGTNLFFVNVNYVTNSITIN